jgi:DNA-binding transcriptional LysR family regulator
MTKILHDDWQAFLQIGLTGSFSRAAKDLKTQQPGLSRRMKRLERELGIQLFERTNRGARLTQTGQTVFGSLVQQRDLIQNAVAEGLKVSQEAQGLFRVGCHQAVALSYLPLWVPTMLKDFPKLRLEFHFMESVEVMTKLRDGELDYGLVVNPQPFADLVLHPIAAEKVGVYGRQKTKSFDVLFFNPEMIMQGKIKRALGQFQAQSVPVPDYQVMALLAQSTPGSAAILPERIAEREGLQKCGDVSGVIGRIHLAYRTVLRSSTVTSAILKSLRP